MSKMFNYEADHIHDMVHPNLLTESTHYVSECKDILLTEATPNYPKLTDYESEWLYFYEHEYQGGGNPVDLEYQTLEFEQHAIVHNAIPFNYKSAILKGSTKYRDIDTGDILDTFDETKNLELVSVKMPVLTTSNEDDTKTNILTVNEEVELRGISDVKDELNLLTGELINHFTTTVLNGSESWTQAGTQSSGFIRFYTNAQTAKSPTANVISPNFPCYNGSTINYGINGTENITGKSSNNFFSINISMDRIGATDLTNKTENVALFKQWLSNNPITIKYELKTPVVSTIELQVGSQAPFEGTNHFTTSSDTIPPSCMLSIPVESIGAKTLNDISQED